MKRTPLHGLHVEAGARMVPFAGYEMPVQYSGVLDEHVAVRTAAGLFDVSHMGEVVVRGSGATEFLQSLTPNDVSALRSGRAHYNALLTEQGTFLDDLLVYCRSSSDYLLVVNAAGREHDLAWLRQHATAFDDLEIEDQSEKTALLALQGPRAIDILQPLTEASLSRLRYYRFRQQQVLGQSVLVSRTGYTGEDGFELYVDSEHAEALWRALIEAGSKAGLRPAGLAARDTLRLEAGMLLAGQDIDRETNPLEAGLDWMVKFDQGEFVGKSALIRCRDQGLDQRLIGFVLDDRGIARSGSVLRSRGNKASQGFRGTVTSGSWSPTLERAIGIAKVTGAELASIAAGDEVEIDVRNRTLGGKVVDLPFYRRSRN